LLHGPRDLKVRKKGKENRKGSKKQEKKPRPMERKFDSIQRGRHVSKKDTSEERRGTRDPGKKTAKHPTRKNGKKNLQLSSNEKKKRDHRKKEKNWSEVGRQTKKAVLSTGKGHGAAEEKL